MKITELSVYKGDTYKLELDGEETFFINSLVVSDFMLYKGGELSGDGNDRGGVVGARTKGSLIEAFGEPAVDHCEHDVAQSACFPAVVVVKIPGETSRAHNLDAVGRYGIADAFMQCGLHFTVLRLLSVGRVDGGEQSGELRAYALQPLDGTVPAAYTAVVVAYHLLCHIELYAALFDQIVHHAYLFDVGG